MTDLLNTIYTGLYFIGWGLGLAGAIGVVATLLRLLVLYSKRSHTVNAKRYFVTTGVFFGVMLIGNVLSDKGEAWLSEHEQAQKQEQTDWGL